MTYAALLAENQKLTRMLEAAQNIIEVLQKDNDSLAKENRELS